MKTFGKKGVQTPKNGFLREPNFCNPLQKSLLVKNSQPRDTSHNFIVYNCSHTRQSVNMNQDIYNYYQHIYVTSVAKEITKRVKRQAVDSNGNRLGCGTMMRLFRKILDELKGHELDQMFLRKLPMDKKADGMNFAMKERARVQVHQMRKAELICMVETMFSFGCPCYIHQ